MDTLPTNPVVTIITVVRNGMTTLEACLASVAPHSSPAIEHVVIDGGSTDGTVDIIRKHQDTLRFWTSEPDQGIYDAMNKGVREARGNWILFLGCDDELSLIFPSVIPLLKDKDTIYYGNAYWRKSRRTYDGPFPPSKLARTNICQQAILYPRSALFKHPFNLRYRYQADWEVNMRCFSDPGITFQYIPLTLSTYNDATGASTSNRDLTLEKDYIALVWRHFPWPIALWRSCITFGGRALHALGWKGKTTRTSSARHDI